MATVAAGSGGFIIYGQDAYDRCSVVAGAGDINGDGFDDLLIGARRGDGAGNAKFDAGDIYVVFGKAGGGGASIDLATVAAGSGGFVIHGQDAYDLCSVVAGAGDINGDGFDDLVIGAGGGDGAGNTKPFAGESYVVFGKPGGFGASIDLATIAAGFGGFVIYGEDAGDVASSIRGAGDINGDGFDDLIVGAPRGAGPGNGRRYAGDSYVVFGKAGGFGASIDLATIAAGFGGFVIYGETLDGSGLVAGAGDINGDGFDDLVVGATGFASNGGVFGPTLDGPGKSYVIYGRDFTGTVTHPGTTASETLTGTNTADNMVGGLGDDILNGFAGADVLLGGHGNDTLNGGTGADHMAGDQGNDIYHVDSAADHVKEASGEGSDTVYAKVNYTLNTGSEIEFLRANAGATGLSLTGNQFANAIIGNAGNDTLSGGGGKDTLNGGLGADTMAGNQGDDVYLVDNAADVVIEALGEGSDTIYAKVDYTIGAGSEIEFLRANAGATGLALIGNERANTIIGNSGNDTITGGLGADILNGAGGTDRFVYTDTSHSTYTGFDRIAAFAHGIDLIDVTAIASVTAVQGLITGAAQVNAHSIAWIEIGANTQVLFNTSGAAQSQAASQMRIVLNGTGLGLAATDFLHA